MVKNDLRRRGFEDREILPKEWKISILWAFLTVALIYGTINLIPVVSQVYFDIFDINLEREADPLRNFNAFLDYLGYWSYILYFIVPMFILLFSRHLITIVVCKDNYKSIGFKLLKNKSMPICTCKEALKIWHIALIYLVPIALIYVPLFILSVLSFRFYGAIYLTVLTVFTFFWSFDLTLLVYIFWLKIATNGEYFSIDDHVYRITVFRNYNRDLKPKKFKGIFTP